MGFRPEDEKALELQAKKDFGVTCPVPRAECSWKQKADTQDEIIEQLRDNQAKLNAQIESFEKEIGKEMTQKQKEELLEKILKGKAVTAKDNEIDMLKTEKKSLEGHLRTSKERESEFEKELAAVRTEEQLSEEIQEKKRKIKFYDRLIRNQNKEIKARTLYLGKLKSDILAKEEVSKTLEQKIKKFLMNYKSSLELNSEKAVEKALNPVKKKKGLLKKLFRKKC